MKIAFLVIAAFASCNTESGLQCGPDPESQDTIKTCTDRTLNTVEGLDGIFCLSSTGVGLFFGSLTKDVLHIMCTNKETVFKFIRCADRKLKSRFPSEIRAIQATDDTTVESMISVICDNAKETGVHFMCAQERISSSECTRTAADLNIPPKDQAINNTFIKYICRERATLTSCLINAMSDCPGKTSEVMAKVFDKSQPSFCSAGAVVGLTRVSLVISFCFTGLMDMI